MASIRPHSAGYRVQVYHQGRRDSKVFRTRKEAAQWALEREAELSGKKLPANTLDGLLSDYARNVAPLHKGHRWELLRIKSLRKDALARRQLAGLSPEDFEAWRDTRLRQVAPGTVAREMNLLRSVLEHAVRPLRWLKVNPMKEVDWPTTPAARRRRVMPDEVDAIAIAFKVVPLAAATQTQRVGLAFLFALETGMRSGEICGLGWGDVHLTARFVVLPATKNGDRREVPLSSAAVRILELLPREADADGNLPPVFGLTDRLRDALWRKYRPKALADLTFHDSRGEAVWRLSKKLDVLQLAQVIGHRDLKSLQHYYRETAAELAAKLD